MATTPRRLPSGNWNTVVRLPNGKRKSITDPLKRIVMMKAQELELAASRGEAVHMRDRRVTVEQWHERWQRTRMVEASTGRKDESRWRNYVRPQWGRWPISSITRDEVQQWVKDLVRAGVGAHAIEGAYEYLSAICASAADSEIIPATPCRKVTLPRRGKPEPRWLTRLEYDRLQLALGEATTVLGGRKTVPDPHARTWQAMVGLGCFSGLRPGELAGLDVSAIDFDRQLVRVTQVLARVPDGVKPNGRPRYRMEVRPYPKSDRSVRSVPFPDEVGELLWRVAADKGAGPVFVGARGGRVNTEGNFRSRVWLPALERAGIEPVRPYVWRHTCCSWLVQAGVSDRRIMQIMGHSTTDLIDVYGHLRPDAHDEVRAAWAAAASEQRRTNDPRGIDEGIAEGDLRWSEARPVPENGQ